MEKKQFSSPNTLTGILPRGWGTPRKIGCGVSGLLPKTRTLFMTKICDFQYAIYDLTKNSLNIVFMTVAAGTVALKIIYEELLLMILLIMMKMYLLVRNIPISKLES